ncbi:MAG TPA: molybdenum cofactor guanylyltransferase [Thermoanaerobaculia bacterium]|nr:molybdenum cofactor guanylyltransferase [Thermoanaerobaculia bacterium]
MPGASPVLAPVGIVLAGGLSRRLGRDKASLEVGGESLALRAARRLAEICSEVAIADAGRGSIADFPSLPDGPGRGPAAGLLGAEHAFPARSLLVLACDLPEVPAALLAEAARAEAAGWGDWVVPRWRGNLEPLAALYRPRALSALRTRALRGEHALHRLAEEGALAIRYLDEDLLRRFGDPAAMFLNLNTPDDLARWRALATG